MIWSFARDPMSCSVGAAELSQEQAQGGNDARVIDKAIYEIIISSTALSLSVVLDLFVEQAMKELGKWVMYLLLIAPSSGTFAVSSEAAPNALVEKIQSDRLVEPIANFSSLYKAQNQTTQGSSAPSDPYSWTDHKRRLRAYNFREPYLKTDTFLKNLWGCLVSEFHDVRSSPRLWT